MNWSAAEKANPSLALIPPPLRTRAERWALEEGACCSGGDTVHAVFAVLHGEIRLVRRNRNGTKVVLQRSRGGFVAGSTLLRFPAQAFRDALNDDAAIREAWMAHLGREVRKLRT